MTTERNHSEPLRNLLDGEVGEQLEETARIFFQNQSITVNAAAAAAAIAAGLACKYWLLLLKSHLQQRIRLVQC